MGSSTGGRERRRGFALWLVVSLLVAATGFWWGPGRWLAFAGPNDVPTSEILSLCIKIGWLWLATFVVAVVAYRRRALWLIVGAPFVLFWPVMWIFVARACSLLGTCG
jgi:hypothetical protein